MVLNRVIAVVRGGECDAEVAEHAAGMLRPGKGRAVRGRLLLLYVIGMPRSLPVDAELPAESRRGEEALQRLENLLRMDREDIEGVMVQARAVGPAVVREAVVREADGVVLGVPFHSQHGGSGMDAEVEYVLKHAPCTVVLWRQPPRRV